jgi:signal transduction histidine kinase/ActR/RegA family two-component response regulator
MLLNARQIHRAETATGTLLLAIEDITARREADALRAARAAAEAANRAKDDFIAVLSHELRTPLNAILGWARVLRLGRQDLAKPEQGLEAIQRNAESQAQLLEGLLDVSRIATGKLELELRPVDFVAVIEAAVEAARPAAEAKGVRMEARLDPAAAPVWGDRERLQQIVGNLLSNAVKFTPTAGAVEVTLEAVESRARLVVRDTGQGIAPQFLPHLFERFSQAEGSTTRTHRGLGLGLAIVQHLVRLHGGVVRADSPGVGQGATLTVELPLLEGETATAREVDRRAEREGRVPAAGERPDLWGLSVLVVDDEDDALELLATELRAQGARVALARTAREALDALERDRPDAIVSDIGLPTEDGYSLIRKVRARPPQQGGLTPAVALTAFASRDDASRALEAGYQTHLTKPVDSAALLRVIASLTGRTGAL